MICSYDTVCHERTFVLPAVWFGPPHTKHIIAMLILPAFANAIITPPLGFLFENWYTKLNQIWVKLLQACETSVDPQL